VTVEWLMMGAVAGEEHVPFKDLKFTCVLLILSRFYGSFSVSVQPWEVFMNSADGT
jgi:hypothetical protein